MAFKRIILTTILRSERGSVGIGTVLATTAAAAAGAAASKGVGSLLNGGPSQAGVLTPEQLAQAQQSAVGGLQGQQTFANGLQGAGQQGVDAQQALLAALQMQAQGQGPNVAQAQLAQNTQQNVANQAALAAGTRGASANAGLVARGAAQQGAGIQQQAVGQAATLQAQQQLAAQSMLGQQANQQVAQQGNALGAVSTAAQGILGQGNQAALGQAAANNAFNSPINQQVQTQIGQGVNNAGIALLGAKQPQPAKMAEGGSVKGEPLVAGDSEENDVVPTMLSPGEIVIPRSYASNPEAAAAFAHACAMFNGKGDK